MSSNPSSGHNDGGPVSPKVVAGGSAGAASVLIVWLVSVIFGVQVPEPVAGGIPVLIAVIAAWWQGDPLRAIGLAVAVRNQRGKYEAPR